jgi:hypothetical protein
VRMMMPGLVEIVVAMVLAFVDAALMGALA